VRRDQIEDIYGLSPVQEGMLFQALHEPGAATYLQQFVFTLEGDLAAPVFAGAFQEVVARHPALRTAFLWERAGRPLQVVVRRAELPVAMERWPAAPPEQEQREVAALLRQDRQRGCDLGEPPLLRLTLVRVGAGRLHYLLWTYHHLILDGWSMALVLREVLARYQAATAGPAFDRPPPRPFADYVAWLARQDLAAAEAYWRRTLAGVEAATPLPGGELAGEARGDGTGKQTVVLAAALGAALAARARRSGLTLATLAHGAWALWLSRASDVDEVVFGTVVSGRPAELEGVEDMVGMFINTLPARVRIVAGQPLGEWLRELQAAQLEMRRFEYSPLSRVQAWSEVPAGRPLFESILVFENRALFGGAGDARPAGGPRLRAVDFQGGTGYPLTAGVEPGDGLALTLAYDPRRFDAVTIRRWLGHLANLLESLAGDLDRPAASVSLLAESERQQLVVEWNDRRLAMGEECLHRRFAAQSAHTPDAVALTCGDESLSYRELDRQADRLAHYLRRLGVGPEVLVAILLRRSHQQIVAVLGVLKAGGAYLPLDAEQPAPRLAAILAGSGAPLLLTRGGLAEGLAVPGLRPVRLDEAAAAVACCPAGPPASGVEPANLAYVIYTSGSSGQPKGVMVPHRAIGSTLGCRQLDFPLGGEDRVLQTTAFGFDASLWSIFAPLLAGARLVLSLPEGAAAGDRLGELVARHRITAMQLPPSSLRLFLEQLEPGAAAELRFVICGGEALTAELEQGFFARLDASLHNFYGPTEAALDTTFWTCRRGESRRTLPIGRPIAGKQVYLLDRGMRPVAIGAAGELCIGGEGLARAYLHDPALTAARFVPHPWSATPGARLYRSGDLARWLPDGNLEFIGRADRQLKIRGHRIEPGEIEAALGSHPDVRQAVVAARQDRPGGAPRLVAWVVYRAARRPSASELRRFLEGRLPESMIPAIFVALGALPENASGKVDRARLPAPGAAQPTLAGAYSPPRDERERRLAAVWGEVLGVERVGIDDNFFELGGDSILSLQIVARARKAGFSFTTAQLFAHQTVAELAAAAPGSVREVQAEQGAAAGEAPLTPIQRWFFAAIRTDRHHWNQAVLLAARRRLAAPLLARAAQALLAHHDALRLCFVAAGGRWRQFHAAAAGAAAFACLDLAALPGERRQAAFEAAAAEIQAGFDLARGPLLRVALFELGGADAARLLLVAHHLVVDGVSWRLLLEDLGAVYAQLVRGEPPRLPPKTTSFQHWAERLHEHARSPAVAAELDAWLAAATAVEPLPRDRRAGRNCEAMRRTVRVELSPEETRALLRDVPRTYGARLEDALLAAVALAFRAWTGRSRLLVDLEGHGREEIFDDVDLSRTVGWFTTEHPVLLSVGEQAEGAAALRAVSEQLRRVPGRGVGYGLLRYLHPDTAIRRRLAAMPQAEVVFNYLGQFDGTLATLAESSPWGPARESAGPLRGRRGERPYLFELNGSVARGRLLFDWSYSAELHDRATVERLARGFLAALRQLAVPGAAAGVTAGAAAVAVGPSPADFPLAAVDQPALDRLTAAGRRLEDLYPLSPMQQGLLFDSLHAGGGVYVMQLACVLRGDLDAAAFGAAWRQLIDRHPVLRTAFVWEGCDQPLQMVLRDVAPVLAEDDWRQLDAMEQDRRLEQLAAERRLGFDLTRAPLVQADLLRRGEGCWSFLWSSHHLVLDGWSTPMLFADLFALYQASRRGVEAELPARRPFRDYIAWLGERDMAAAERHFRRVLRGYAGASPLAPLLLPPELRRRGESLGDVRRLLSVAGTAELKDFARHHRLTLNTLVQGAWALLLGRLGGDPDVVFGATVGGRAAALAGAEEMIGMFINTLPVRLPIEPGRLLVTWLREHQQRQAEIDEHAHTPLAKIQQWCPPRRGAALFDSIVVFENYPQPAGGSVEQSGLEMGHFRYWIREGFPLILDVGPGAELSLRLKFDDGLYQGAAAAEALADLEALLAGFVAAPAAPLASFAALLEARAEERHERRRRDLREVRHQRLRQAARRRGGAPGTGG
jgi:amino acid adenylation domain-containing protein/non-ribosomal peptide synthase protein (TIGR01720 family)